ncbi:MAG: HK97 family phage prohead protease [Roseomonas sp.]|nr:HK97 family phage prohead protease [Roseomonas sp.]MCA3335745.1 HK97 family phage prohead protease [Roseomonas sp.]MCA3355567.1 HK97 family phage prohead protease [Roseomonas sp.]MCA3385524.1 HK97 family phage prohead protease [Roseomonas sp.]MCA3394343.1 HK97 family phage prohead protease [Roseomonas sp.]
MTETTDPGGSDPAPADPALPDRLPADGQSITARRAITAPATVDRAARTVEVVWSTGARARNFVPSLGGITEELDMSPNAVRMAQLGSGNAPVLNTHRSSDARDVLGRVIAARLEGGRGHARLQFSAAADVEPLWQRIADGTLRAVSIGYRVHRYDQRPDPVSGEMIYRAVDWEPFEISIVPIPVDRDAQVRGAALQGAPSFAIEPALADEEIPMTETTPETPAAHSAPPAASPPATITVETPPDLEALRSEAQRAERDRISGIDGAIDAARALVGTETAAHIRREAVERGWHPDQARRSLFDAMVKSAAPPAIPARPETGPGHDSPPEILDAMAEALAARSMPGYQPQGTGRHAEFMGWRPSDMIGELLRVRGERNVPRNPTLLAERAFHTTSDFPLLLSAAANKMLLAAYQPAAPSYRQIFLRRDFRDFKPHRHLRVGDFPTLMPLMENGEIQAGTMSESQEIVLLQTFARRIRVTRPMLVNDDLGAFTDFAAAIGRRVADFENATAYALLNQANGDGPTLTNGPAAVFGTAAARLNKAAAGSALDINNLANGRAAILRQKTLDGLPISVGNAMKLLVGPSLELPARQLTVSVGATQISHANIYAGFVQPLVEPLIPNNRWYLFADPPTAPVYVYGYLNGAEGPQVTTGPVSGVDGVEVSVIFDFGVGAIDWRGAWFNPGA